MMEQRVNKLFNICKKGLGQKLLKRCCVELEEALADRTLYDAIVEHRKAYYALKYVNYDLHAPTTINFMIPEQSIESWKADYADMRRFFIYGQSLEFDALMQKMKELQERIRTMATY